jgi:hypothetical protein
MTPPGKLLGPDEPRVFPLNCLTSNGSYAKHACPRVMDMPDTMPEQRCPMATQFGVATQPSPILNGGYDISTGQLMAGQFGAGMKWYWSLSVRNIEAVQCEVSHHSILQLTSGNFEC